MSGFGCSSRPLIAIVGPCAAGKRTLAHGLRARGYNARRVLQEHSYVPDMWRRITRPDLLIYLDASLETIRRRRAQPDWPEWMLELEVGRLSHARACCDLYLKTDELTIPQVLERVLDWLGAQGVVGQQPPCFDSG
jgi:hypothetical protein